MGVPPCTPKSPIFNHLNGIFLYEASSYWGTPMTKETSISSMTFRVSISVMYWRVQLTTAVAFWTFCILRTDPQQPPSCCHWLVIQLFAESIQVAESSIFILPEYGEAQNRASWDMWRFSKIGLSLKSSIVDFPSEKPSSHGGTVSLSGRFQKNGGSPKSTKCL